MAGTVASEYVKTYTTFSGCDIVCTFGNTVIGELQAITYSASREKAPIYTLGSAEPRSFSRGKRGIAGTLVFTVFDRDSLIEGLKEHIASTASFSRIGGDLTSSALSIDSWDAQMSASVQSVSTGNTAADTAAITNKIVATASPKYADEIPPFDVTISFANEYGQKAALVLYGVEILNEGSGFSIDSVTSEKACTFVARRVEYMKKVDDTQK